VDSQSYVTAAGQLTSIEPSLQYVSSSGTTTPGTVSYSASDTPNPTITLANHSASGMCFYIKDVTTGASAGTTYAKQSGSTCNATDSPTGGFVSTW
jgi:hypothetical protein